MKIPNTGQKKALVIVDVQASFLNERSSYIVANIKHLINAKIYDYYADAVFYCDEDSLWNIQCDWVLPKNSETKTVFEIETALKESLHIEKSSRSAFRGNQDLIAELRKNQITEVHIVGTETNDCVLATALDAFDLGFLPYVIEECCESKTETGHNLGIDLLRMHSMSNNSCLAPTVHIP